MNPYQLLEKLYQSTEIQSQCVDINIAVAFIQAMASSDLELQQWMEMLWLEGQSSFSNEQLATDFAQSVLTLFEQTRSAFHENTPLVLETEQWLTVEGNFSDTAILFATGYLQALTVIDQYHEVVFVEHSAAANLQQTSLLLLNKIANGHLADEQMQLIYDQLPENSEIIAILPTLLSAYGHYCLAEIE